MNDIVKNRTVALEEITTTNNKILADLFFRFFNNLFLKKLFFYLYLEKIF
jgi:hypothetical protein